MPTVDEKAPHRSNSSASDHGTAIVGSVAEMNDLTQLGYKPEMVRNRSMLTLLFQSLAIAAIRTLCFFYSKCQATDKETAYGEGSPLISAIYGGGQLSIFLGWIVVLILDE